MSSSALDHPRKPGQEEEPDLAGYEAINPWAVVTLGLGIVSLAVIFLTWMMVLPLVTIAAGFVALYQMSDENSGMGGRWMAVAGLSLALFAGGTALGRESLRLAMLRAEARQVGEAWLALLKEGDLPAAHQMTLVHTQRQSQEIDLKQLYATGDRAKDLKMFFDSPPLDKILTHAADGEFAYEQENTSARGDREEVVDQLYRLEWKNAAGSPERLQFRLLLERTLHPTLGYGRWRVGQCTLPSDKG